MKGKQRSKIKVQDILKTFKHKNKQIFTTPTCKYKNKLSPLVHCSETSKASKSIQV